MHCCYLTLRLCVVGDGASVGICIIQATDSFFSRTFITIFLPELKKKENAVYEWPLFTFKTGNYHQKEFPTST